MINIFITAGDVSGDVHGAKLMRAIKNIQANVKFIGFGGELMCNEGLKSLAPIEKLSVMGFYEVIKNYFFFKKLLDNCKSILKNEIIDAYIPIDYPGFNIRLATYAKEINIPVYYYIAPQLWAWGKNRAKKIQNITNKLFVIFPFEEEFFRKYEIDAKFVGHPFMEEKKYISLPTPLLERENLCAIMPGSRRQELEKHLPILKDTIEIIHKQMPDIKFGTVASSEANKKIIAKMFAKDIPFKFYETTVELLKNAKIGIIKSGTSNLEATLFAVPYVSVYKTSRFTYYMAKKLMNLPWVSITNILAKKEVVKELLQYDFTSENVAKYTIELLKNNKLANDTFINLIEIRKNLGDSSASSQTAKIILEDISKLKV